MLKWILTLAVAVFIWGVCAPHLARVWRLGRLPGDIRLRLFGRELFLLLASALVLALLASVVTLLL